MVDSENQVPGRLSTYSKTQLPDAINDYVAHPEADAENRRSFIVREVVFTDGSAGRKTGEFLASVVESGEE